MSAAIAEPHLHCLVLIDREWKTASVSRQHLHALLCRSVSGFFYRYRAPLAAPTRSFRLRSGQSVLLAEPSAWSEWFAATRQFPVHPTYFRVGDWIVLQDHEDNYYMKPLESMNGSNLPRFPKDDLPLRQPPDWNYDEMVRYGGIASLSPFETNRLMRQMLRGQQGATPPGLAVATAAIWIAEVRRNWVTQMMNLMLLDLVDANRQQWARVLGQIHPMARGGPNAEVQARLAGGNGHIGGANGSETQKLEVDIAMQWFDTFFGPFSDGWVAYTTGRVKENRAVLRVVHDRPPAKEAILRLDRHATEFHREAVKLIESALADRLEDGF